MREIPRFGARRGRILGLAFAVCQLLCVTLASAQSWTSQPIGGAGSATVGEYGTDVLVYGTGRDIWDDADAFNFYSRQWTGGGEFVARLSGLDDTHGWAKAGLMFRETLAADSRHVMICATGENGTNLTTRQRTGGDTSMQGVTWQTALPVWLKIVRRGDTFTGYTSVDGQEWTLAGTATLAGAPTTLYAGLAVTSHVEGVWTRATFDNVVINSPEPAAGVPVIAPRAAMSLNSGALVTFQILATNSPTRYGATGLPAGLTLNPDTGEIRGVCGGNRGTYDATLSATNAAGTGSVVQTFAVSGSGPIEMPAIRSIEPPPDGTYHVGETMLFVVTFEGGYSPPFVTGRPRLPFTLGSNARHADYAWGTGTYVYGFAYTVQPGDVGASGVVTGDTIDLNGGSLRDDHGLWCALNWYPTARPGIRCEGAVALPAAPVITVPDVITAIYDSDFVLQVTATGAPSSYMAVVGSTPARPLGLTFDSTTGVLSGRPQASGAYTLQLGATNGVGAGSKTVRLEIPHVIARVEPPARGTYHAGDTLAFRVTFSNPVQITGAPFLNFGIGSQRRFATTSPGSGQTHTFTYVVQAGDAPSNAPLGFGPQLALNGGTIRDAATGDDFAIELPKGTDAQGVIVNSPPVAAPVITSPKSVTGYVGVWFNYEIRATNMPTQLSASGLPPGLWLDPATGVISGSLRSAGTHVFTVSATNASGTSQQIVTLNVLAVGWQSRDLGWISRYGSSTDTGGIVTVSGAGADIWGTSDAFHFRYAPLTGDGELIARVATMTVTDDWAKVGLMVRENLTADSRYHWVGISGRNGSFAQTRTAVGAWTQITTPTWTTVLPTWLRIQRAGEQVRSYVSSDGVSWTQVSQWAPLDPNATVYIGFAVCSHNIDQLCTATFDNVQATLAPASPKPTILNLSLPKMGEVMITWLDFGTDEQQFQILRSTDNRNFAVVGTAPPNATTFTDVGVAGGTTYYYRVAAVTPSGTWQSAAEVISTPATPGWASLDIGAVGVGGSIYTGVDSIGINGAGADIWGAQDAFRFVYRLAQGDFTADAQVTMRSAPNGWAKAGIMIRESLNPGARNVFVFVTRDTLIAAQIRRSADTELTAGYYDGRPQWLRLVRRAGHFSLQTSPDNATWVEIAAYDIALPQSCFVGFAVSSHDSSSLATAEFYEPSVR